MVLIEEVADEEVSVVKADLDKTSSSSQATTLDQASTDEGKKKAEPALKKGFLNDAKDTRLYGPEGSPEGVIPPEAEKKHMEHKLNKEMNEKMNPMGDIQDNLPAPEWYNPEWPKGCQYNSPGCVLTPMEVSAHQTPLHKDMVQKNERFQEALRGGQETIRLSFLQLTDEDVTELCKVLRGNAVVCEIDLSYNQIRDTGIQELCGALCAGAAPNLKELRLYENPFGELGRTIVEGGLKVLRKKLTVLTEQPKLSFTQKE